MMTTANRQLRRPLTLTALSCVAVGILGVLEGPGWGVLCLLPALPLLSRPSRQLILAAQCAAFLGTLAVSDLGLSIFTTDSLGDRAQRTHAWLSWRAAPADDLVEDPCAQFRYRAGVRTPRGEVRDEQGRLVWTVPGEDPLRIGVIGDSVFHAILGRRLHEGLRRAGRASVVIDTSIYGYNLNDYLCMVERLAAEDPPLDLLVLGLVLNDEGRPVMAHLDLGQGTHTYDVMSYIHDNPAVDQAPPLLVAREHPWVAARRSEIEARWGGALVYDVDDTSLLTGFAFQVDGRLRRAGSAMQRLLTRLQEVDVPAVVTVMPLIVEGPNPSDVLVDTWLSVVKDAGIPTLDLRPTFAAYPHEVLCNLQIVDLWSGQGLFDIVHYNGPAMAMAAEALLATAAAAHGLQVRPALRLALLPQQDDSDRGYGFTCAPQALAQRDDGVWSASSPCTYVEVPLHGEDPRP
jgi:hypothetical protein